MSPEQSGQKLGRGRICCQEVLTSILHGYVSGVTGSHENPNSWHETRGWRGSREEQFTSENVLNPVLKIHNCRASKN